MSDAHEVKADKDIAKLKAFLIEIMLNPEWIDGLEDYKWYPKYTKHMTYAGYVHTRGLIKYSAKREFGIARYELSVRGKKWLDKQQGESK